MPMLTDNLQVKSRTNESGSRWVCQGVPLIIGIGVAVTFVLRSSFGLPVAKLALPVSVLVVIQSVFYVSMFAVRQRYRRTRDMRTGVFVTGMYGLCIVLTAMYYASELGIASARAFEDNYVGFSAYMGVVTCIAVVAFSFVKPKPKS
jgi:hypothetical protein